MFLGQGGDPLDDRVCSSDRLLVGVAGQENRELVAAEPEGLPVAPQLARHVREQPIAGRVAVAVVDSLQVVHVDQAEREGSALRGCDVQLLLEALLEGPVVPEPGQGVRHRETHRAQLAVVRALVERDCDQRPDERGRDQGRALPEQDERERSGGHQREGTGGPSPTESADGFRPRLGWRAVSA